MERVKDIFKTNPKADHYKVYEEVCEEYKQEWLKETNDGITEHAPN
jgi:hypothetical protein